MSHTQDDNVNYIIFGVLALKVDKTSRCKFDVNVSRFFVQYLISKVFCIHEVVMLSSNLLIDILFSFIFQITMSALQPGQPGSALLLKTENGQYRLLQLGPAASQPGQPALPNSGANQTIRIQTVPSVSRFTGPPLALRKTIVTQQPLKTKANVNLNSLFKTNFFY